MIVAGGVTRPVAWALDWDRLALVSMTAVGVIVGVAMLAGRAPLPGDAQFYWLNTPGQYEVAGYVYPPVLSQLLAPVRLLGPQVFVLGWMVLCFASLGYVLGRWAFLALAMVVPAVTLGSGWYSGPIEAVFLGNVTMPMVAAMVLGMTRPGWWAVPILSKMTPGVGVLWFAFRGEWRAFATALGVAAAVVGISFALAPDAWWAFAAFVRDSAGATSNGPAIVGPPLWVRLPLAVVLVAYGARTNRPWLVPIAAATALLGLYGVGTWASVACGALHWLRPDDDRQDAVLRLRRRDGLREGR